ncbi:peptidase E [Bacillus sp. BRMEA1]|uniref:Type 1 glutamine amidotransferase-like domain-containing protein n=1 Tax=Neobacillus endophyticus TaxID=2738405 RepID=UPI001567A9C5|nr:peptidase E [Neobacillus endophyticus]NRD76960.1 peptidase E [Neobacillus endophyticus]
MGTIVAIGGGEIRELETLAIDEYIVSLANKTCPHALFIPTASGESQGYIDSFHRAYGGRLGCQTDSLYLIHQPDSSEEIKRKILSADIIYVGGGDTDSMLKIWKEQGVDLLLKEAYQQGTILSGLSAGAICWFQYGHSDSLQIRKESTEYIVLEGLGFIPGIHCPHFNDEERKADFITKMNQLDTVGIALENNCAIEVQGQQFKIPKTCQHAKGYKIYKKNGEIVIEELVNTDYYLPLEVI